MAELQSVRDGEKPVPDAETMLTPLNATGNSPRALMARKLADVVVLPAGRISGNERALVADILLQVLDKVDEAQRIEVAERVSRVAECPPALVRMLLLDTPAVAENIILRAETLPEALLIEAARDGATAHRLMIARRIDLTPSIADACLQYDEIEVCRLILKREECQISPTAINRLVAMSATHANLQALLLRRPELEPVHGFMMFWWLGAEQRRRALTRFALDRQLIQDTFADLYPRVFCGGESDPFVEEILILAERRHRPRGLDGETVSQDVVRRTLAAANGNAEQEMIDAVSMIGGISRELAGLILRDTGGEPYAVLCKALRISRDDFFEFFDNRNDNAPETARSEYLLAVFDTISRDYARAILRYWDWDSNPRIAEIKRLRALIEDDVDNIR